MCRFVEIVFQLLFSCLNLYLKKECAHTLNYYTTDVDACIEKYCENRYLIFALTKKKQRSIRKLQRTLG